MPAKIKAVVFRTSRLKETKEFFITTLGFVIKESSFRHFVIYSKGIRLLFVESDNPFNVELYMSNVPRSSGGLLLSEDPNGITCLVTM